MAKTIRTMVAIHNKNGKGLLLPTVTVHKLWSSSQSTIKMEKGYYLCVDLGLVDSDGSQSTIKMEKGYYYRINILKNNNNAVAIHNKNGKGLLLPTNGMGGGRKPYRRNPQ